MLTQTLALTISLALPLAVTFPAVSASTNQNTASFDLQQVQSGQNNAPAGVFAYRGSGRCAGHQCL